MTKNTFIDASVIKEPAVFNRIMPTGAEGLWFVVLLLNQGKNRPQNLFMFSDRNHTTVPSK